MPTELRTKTIVELVRAVAEAGGGLGKTQLQKLVYFLQSTGIRLDYGYEIYHFGPYCFQLAEDLNSLGGLGVLNVDNDSSGYGFHIGPGEFSDKYHLEGTKRKALQKVVADFGKNSAAQLEVKATLHFVNRILGKSQKSTRKEIISKVRALKPHFSAAFVEGCYEDLRSKKYI